MHWQIYGILGRVRLSICFFLIPLSGCSLITDLADLKPPTLDAGTLGAREPETEAGSDAAVTLADADAALSSADTGVDAEGMDAAGPGLNVGLVAFYEFDETSGSICADSSGNKNDGTLQGGATFGSGHTNNALTLNGSNQYVNLPPGLVMNLTSFTVATWVKLNSAVAWNRIYDFGTGTTKYMYLVPVTSANAMRFGITTGGNADGIEQRLDGAALMTGTWQHVAVTLMGSTGILYTNGVQSGQQTITLTPSSLGATSQNWLGRSQFSGNSYLNGQIDNFRIYDRALSANEVQQLVKQNR